ncbi:TolC family protein [Desulfonatronovibrio hydrogenovorans]|uniref:TolC family protein n=1 Tax=Desulfonatronovibrio hydrogenovorans TaxID=53245 RepID=UPI00048D7F10|nr:TolC family protein [Desulfonatronovibrio hydrogenovorans]
MTLRVLNKTWLLPAIAVLYLILIVPGQSQAWETPASSGYPLVMELSLTDAVFMALRHNRSLESAYLDRVLARFNLRRDLTKFHPDLEIDLGAETDITEESTTYQGDDRPDSRVTTRSTGTYATTRISQNIPTGAELSFVWDNRARTTRTSTRDASARRQPMDTGWGVEFSQPLLKDGGWAYSTASVTKARLNEENAVRSMRDAVIDTVTLVIKNYRDLLRAYQDLKVQQESLHQARQQMELTRVLITTGRRAANEILQSEANVARQEFALENARSSLDNAHLALLNSLNIGRDITIIPTEEIAYRTVEPDLEQCLEIAFARNSGYLNALNQKEVARLSILEAENQKMWDLSLDAGYSQGWNRDRHGPDPDYRRDEWNVGLSLNIPLPLYGNAKYQRESPLLQARIALRKAAMNILTTEENLENQVRNEVRRVQSAHRQVEMARRTRQLSEQSFEVSELEFRLGRISNVDFIREQDKLRDDRLAEIQAIISYENVLTDLDRLLATSLDTWEIEFTPHRADLEEELLGRRTWMLGN